MSLQDAVYVAVIRTVFKCGVYVCVRACVHVRAYTYVCMRACVCVYVCVPCVYMRARVHMCARVCMRVYVCGILLCGTIVLYHILITR